VLEQGKYYLVRDWEDLNFSPCRIKLVVRGMNPVGKTPFSWKLFF
jgi:hypothetical protein